MQNYTLNCSRINGINSVTLILLYCTAMWKLLKFTLSISSAFLTKKKKKPLKLRKFSSIFSQKFREINAF